MPTVAQHMIAALEASGVHRVYGIPGDSLNGFTDAIRRSGGISWEPVRHEEAAAFAATADAALTGRLAVCAGSAGPGNLHLINGLFDAQRTRVAVLAIAAHIPLDEVGSGYFQETHPQELFRECSVYCELVSKPEMAPASWKWPSATAIEQRGVAVVVVPGEVFLSPLSNPDWEIAPVLPTRSLLRPDDESLRRAADTLNGSTRITILAGAGCAGSHDDVVALAATLQAPIVHALRGKEHIEYDNPYDVGMTGLLGFASGYKAIKEADVLLMLGTDFPIRQFYPENATIIQVDIAAATSADAPTSISDGGHRDGHDHRVAAVAHPGTAARPLGSRAEALPQTRKSLDDLAVNDRDRTPIRPEYVARLASQLASDDAVFTYDVGTPTIWAARYLTMNGRRRLIGSATHGSMAGALSHAIGAQSVDRGRQVVALAGDGGLTMLFGELITLKQNRLPVKVDRLE